MRARGWLKTSSAAIGVRPRGAGAFGGVRGRGLCARGGGFAQDFFGSPQGPAAGCRGPGVFVGGVRGVEGSAQDFFGDLERREDGNVPSNATIAGHERHPVLGGLESGPELSLLIYLYTN